MTEPMKASQVETEDDRTQEEIDRERRRAAVQARLAKRRAMVGAGADVADSDSTLAGQLERGLATRVSRQTADFRKRQAAQAAVAERLGR